MFIVSEETLGQTYSMYIVRRSFANQLSACCLRPGGIVRDAGDCVPNKQLHLVLQKKRIPALSEVVSDTLPVSGEQETDVPSICPVVALLYI